MRTYDAPLQNIKPILQPQQLLNRYDPDKVNDMAKRLDEEGQKEPIVLNPKITQIRDGLQGIWRQNNLDGKRSDQQS
jgi:hypothetical protein